MAHKAAASRDGLRLVLLTILAALACSAPDPVRAQRDNLDALNRHIVQLYQSHNYDKALAEAQHLEALLRARVGVKDPRYATALEYLAILYQALDRYGESEDYYRRLLALKEKAVGPDDPQLARTIYFLARMCERQDKYAAAEGFYRRALAIQQTALKPNAPDLMETMNDLAVVYRQEAKYADAEALQKQLIAIAEQAFGRDHPETAMYLNNLGVAYEFQGRYDEAAELYRRVLAVRDRPPREVARTLDNFANLRQRQGKFTEAEDLYKRALAIRQQVLGIDHPEVGQTLNDLAGLYGMQQRYAEAEGLFARALAITQKAYGPDHPEVARMLTNLASVQRSQGKLNEAETVFTRVIGIFERSLGPEHIDLIVPLTDLAGVYEDDRKYGEAEVLLKRALAISEHTVGPTSARTGDAVHNLALDYVYEGKLADAEALYQRAIAIGEKTLGGDHPDLAMTFDNLAVVHAKMGDVAAALADSRRATKMVIALSAAEAGAAQTQSDGLIQQRSKYFLRHLDDLDVAQRAKLEAPAALLGEAFTTAQWASGSEAAAALQQIGARFAAGNDALAALVRENQDLVASRQDRDRKLVAAVSAAPTDDSAATIARLRSDVDGLTTRLAAVAARLEKEFPDYAALASPNPLPAEDVQKLLGGGEALVFFVLGDEASHIFAVTRERIDWQIIPLGARAISDKVAAFRRGLDVDAGAAVTGKIDRAQADQLFDLDLANELYGTLLGPVEALIKDKPQLIVVPSGALTALPFHLLVTAKPLAAVPEQLASYREAAWLIKRQAVTVLPAVASLKTLRGFARREKSGKPLVGFGDPVFNPHDSAPAAIQTADARSVSRGYTAFWQGAGIDRAQLSQLPRLADTADELKAVARRLGAPASDIHLRGDASETTVKRLPLADYRVVYFATHGLVAGDVKGVAEPSLALTLPANPTAEDDGLLTASEVAQLKLNADWVVLSACNTIAGEKPGAEALSGLARAFFYAGARALLVSHWSVDSAAATRLTTSTFDILEGDPKLGRAEALRRAMLAYMNDDADPHHAYPAFWGPFAVIGEGGAN